MFKRIALIVCTFLLLAATPLMLAPGVTVSDGEISTENARFAAFGLVLPPGGIVKQHPYARPVDAHSFVVPLAWYRAYSAQMRSGKPVTIDPNDLRRDLPTLHFIMEQAYSGYGLAQDRGWNWDTWFSAWDTRLASAHDRLPLADAFAPWGGYERFQLDNHSGIQGLMGFTSGSTSALLASVPQTSCTALRFADGSTTQLAANNAAQEPHPVSRWDGHAFSAAWYVSYPERLGTAVSITCNNSTIALKPVSVDKAVSNEPSYRALGDGNGYVRMPTFSDSNNEKLRRVIEYLPRNAAQLRTLVIDLRDNDGGNNALDVMTRWYPQADLDRLGTITQVGTQSCVRTALFFGLQQLLSAGVHPPLSADLKAQMQTQLDGLSMSDCAVRPVETRGSHDLAHHIFARRVAPMHTPRLIVLVDRNCGSDCEYMAFVLAGLPGTVIAGESTYGVFGFSQPGYFVLPFSRVVFRVALSRTDAFGDGRSEDGYGIPADVMLPDLNAQSNESIAALAAALEPH
jgi:hypothetical protein